MTESVILEILTRNVAGNSNTSEVLDFARLSPNCVQHISKNIAGILYDSLTTKSTSDKNKRIDILLLLRKWCTNSGNHLKIDANNYDCLVDSLINASNPCTAIDNHLQTEINKLTNSDVTNEKNVTAEVTEHFKKMEKINIEKAKSLEIISKRDYAKCGIGDVFNSSRLCNPQFTEVLDMLHELELLKDEQCSEEISYTKRTNNHKQDWLLKPTEPLIREKQIGLAYSLLNLNKTARDMLLLSNILKNLSSYEILEPCEINFINNLWQKSAMEDLPSEIPLMLLENFCFIYEKHFIIMCTDALRSSLQSIPVISKDVQRILHLSSRSQKLKCNITSLLYELYACSGYSHKLSYFLTLLK